MSPPCGRVPSRSSGTFPQNLPATRRGALSLMDDLPAERRARIVGLIAEGVPFRTICLLTGASRETIGELLRERSETYDARLGAETLPGPPEASPTAPGLARDGAITRLASPAAEDLLRFAGGRTFATILADPPWRFTNRTGKMAPEHRRLSRYDTLALGQIAGLPVGQIAAEQAHLYLWVPNALMPEGLGVMADWGFTYKSNIVWHKIRKDGGSDGRGVGFYFRNVTELILFGIRGKNMRTLAAGRRQVNLIASRKREHSRKPDEQYSIIEACSPRPFLELFGRGARNEWATWGDQADQDYKPAFSGAMDPAARRMSSSSQPPPKLA